MLSKGFVRRALKQNRLIAMTLAVLAVLSVVPALGLAFVLGQALRQLQSSATDLPWSSLVGNHVARWLEPMVRNTPYESGIPSSIQLIWLPVLLAGVGFIHAAIKGSVEYLSERLSENVAKSTRDSIMRSFFGLNYTTASQVTGSQLATLVGTDVQEIKLGLRRMSGMMPLNIMQSSVLLAWLVVLDTTLFALFAAVLAPSGLAIRFFAKTLKRLAREGLGLQSEVLGLFVERLRGWETIRVFGTGAPEVLRFKDSNRQLFKRLRRAARAAGLGAPTVEWLSTVAGSVIVVIAIRRVAIDELSSSVLTCFLVAVAQLSGTLQSLTRHIASLKRARASIDRVSEFLSLDASPKPVGQTLREPVRERQGESGDAPPARQSNDRFQIATIELRDMGIRETRSNRELVRHLSLSLNRGDFCVVLGASGSGKSTLLRTIIGLHPISSGELLINGNVSDEHGWKTLSKDLCFISQEPFIIHGTLFDNVIFPMKAPAQHSLHGRIEECLRLAELDKRPDSPALELSGGEKQRLMLARAFFKDATLWILDESTSALDAATEHMLLSTIQRNGTSRIIVFVTHRQAVAKFANKRILISEAEAALET